MKNLLKNFAVVALLSVSVLTSCKKEDATPDYQDINQILMSKQNKASVADAQVKLTGSIREYDTKPIASVEYYYMINNQLYTGRKVEAADFQRKSNGEYVKNIKVNYKGNQSSADSAKPYDFYELEVNVPLAEYNLKAGDYVVVGVQFNAQDGSTFKNTRQINIE